MSKPTCLLPVRSGIPVEPYLHDDEENKRDEDVDMGVLPAVGVADVLKLLGHAVAAPGAVVEQRHQRLVLGQLQGGGKRGGTQIES